MLESELFNYFLPYLDLVDSDSFIFEIIYFSFYYFLHSPFKMSLIMFSIIYELKPLGKLHLTNSPISKSKTALSIFSKAIESSDSWTPLPKITGGGTHVIEISPTSQKVSNVSPTIAQIYSSIPYQFTVIEVDHSIHGKNQVVKTLSALDAAALLKKAKTLSIGDLHSSSLKLFETLLVGDLIHMPEESLKKMHTLLLKMENVGNFSNKLLDEKSTSPLSQKVLEDHIKKLVKYDAKMSTLIPDIQWKNKDRKFIVIGDEVADRGAFDPTILKMFRHLDKVAPGNIEYLASNHGHSTLGFIIDNKLKNPLSTNIHSMQKALLAVKDSPQGVLKLKQDYLDHLVKAKIFYWDEKNKTMFSHAPISKECLRTAIGGLNLIGAKIPNYDKLSLKELPKFVEAVNNNYQKFLAEMIAMPPKNRDKDLLFKKQLFATLVNHYSYMDEPSALPFNTTQHGVKLNIHGHYIQPKQSPLEVTHPKSAEIQGDGTKIVNLDNRIRQGSKMSGTSAIVALKE
jgi:hypothetical protein